VFIVKLYIHERFEYKRLKGCFETFFRCPFIPLFREAFLFCLTLKKGREVGEGFSLSFFERVFREAEKGSFQGSRGSHFSQAEGVTLKVNLYSRDYRFKGLRASIYPYKAGEV